MDNHNEEDWEVQGQGAGGVVNNKGPFGDMADSVGGSGTMPEQGQGQHFPSNNDAFPHEVALKEQQERREADAVKEVVNPFFRQPFPFLPTETQGYTHTNADNTLLQSIEMSNPTNISDSAPRFHKGQRQRYFDIDGARKPRKFRGERGILEKQGRINFIPAGTQTTDGIVRPAEPIEQGPRIIEGTKKKAKKRAFDVSAGTDQDAIKRLKITPEKPATALLNDISPSLDYSYEDIKEGPKADPKFVCRVKFPAGEDGKQYVGEGRSKKLAKIQVAEMILQDLGIEIPAKDNGNSEMQCSESQGTPSGMPYPVPLMPSVHSQNFQMMQAMQEDFTSDNYYPTGSFQHDINISPSSPPVEPSMPMPFSVLKRLQNISDFENNSVSAITTLLGTDNMYWEEVSEEGPPHARKFVINLGVLFHEEILFTGIGSSKKRAKSHASKQALLHFLGSKLYENLVCSNPNSNSKSPSSAEFSVAKQNVSPCSGGSPLSLNPELFNFDPNESEYDLVFSDYIARIVNDKFEELMADFPEYISQKVLAGIVMTRTTPMLENGEVVAVTTGTKCVEGDYLSTDGLAINDCHAEVLATRCLRDFLYSEIEDFVFTNDPRARKNSILEPIDLESGEVMYMLKPNVKFHLYISTSPCGDARIFSPKGLELGTTDDTEEAEDSNPNKKNRGLLRAKVEAGEGTIPVDNLISGPQTFDAIVQGNALFTMSCSDKVCRWNVVGVQGALLSNLLFPIYYSSIILGSLHHPVHFKRAVFSRIEGLAGKLPQPFKINRPQLLMVSHEEKRRVKKSPNHAVSWTCGWSTPEILAASKGRCEPGGVASRLSKRMAFMRFLTLYKNATGGRNEFADLSYREAKMAAEVYQMTTQTFHMHMKEMSYGTWIGKPLEIDSFRITNTNN